MRIVTLTSDFGTRDWFVGVMKGVILGRAPGVQVVDLTHEVAPGDLRGAAFALRCACRFFPRGTVHVAVVDPGVGSARSALALRVDGQLFVGPDNGVLSWVLGPGRSGVVRRLENRRLFLAPLSATFHGRDVFAPVAAFLARGGRFDRVGPTARNFVRLPWPEAEHGDGWAVGEVVYVDRFGNVITNLDVPALGGGLDNPRASSRRIRLPGRRACRLGACYAAVPRGEALGVVGSSGLLEIALNGGSAARELGLRMGDRIRVEL